MDMLETDGASIRPIGYYFLVRWSDDVLVNLSAEERRHLHIDSRYISVDAIWQESVIGPIAHYARQLYDQDNRQIVLVRSDGMQVACWP